jgi:hypothetical protein
MITIERAGQRLYIHPEELQNDDIVTGGVLAGGASQPIAVATHVTRLTLRDGNFKNVLLGNAVVLTDVDGTVRTYPAAPHTALWILGGGLRCHALRSVEDRDAAQAAAIEELEAAFRTFEKYFPKLKVAAKEKPAVLTRLRAKFRSLIGRQEAAQLLGCNIPTAGVTGTWADQVIDGGG